MDEFVKIDVNNLILNPKLMNFIIQLKKNGDGMICLIIIFLF